VPRDFGSESLEGRAKSIGPASIAGPGPDKKRVMVQYDRPNVQSGFRRMPLAAPGD